MNDHIPDVTKMIGETPRTDQQNDDLLNSDSYTSWLEISGFARQLERELIAANERIKRLEESRTVAAGNSLANMLSYENAINKIKLLQEAGDGLAKVVERDYATKGFTEPWRKAKEAKL